MTSWLGGLPTWQANVLGLMGTGSLTTATMTCVTAGVWEQLAPENVQLT